MATNLYYYNLGFALESQSFVIRDAFQFSKEFSFLASFFLSWNLRPGWCNTAWWQLFLSVSFVLSFRDTQLLGFHGEQSIIYPPILEPLIICLVQVFYSSHPAYRTGLPKKKKPWLLWRAFMTIYRRWNNIIFGFPSLLSIFHRTGCTLGGWAVENGYQKFWFFF